MRHGKRRAERRLPGPVNSFEFWQAYKRLTSTDPRGGTARRADDYLASPDYHILAARTRDDYARYLGLFRDRFGDFKPGDIEPKHLLAWRDTMADRPSAANHMVAVVQTLYKWAVPRGHAGTNPGRETPRLRHRTEGHQPWPDWAFRLAGRHMRYDLYVAVQLPRYTGQRLTDGLAMRLADIDWKQTWPEISLIQHKTGKPLVVPAHPDMVPLLKDLRQRGWMHLAAKLNPPTEPFTAVQFQAAWGREMKKEPLHSIRASGFSFHGLRKFACVALTEVGGTTRQIQSVSGLSQRLVEHCAAGVDQVKLARQMMAKWRGDDG